MKFTHTFRMTLMLFPLIIASVGAHADYCPGASETTTPFSKSFRCPAATVSVTGERYPAQYASCYNIPIKKETVFFSRGNAKPDPSTTIGSLLSKDPDFGPRTWDVSSVQCTGPDEIAIVYWSGGNCTGCERAVTYHFNPDGKLTGATLLPIDLSRVPTQDICKTTETVPIPQADFSAADARSDLEACDSAALYYGFSSKPDYVRARQCAHLERLHGSNGYFRGAGILSMIYANALGVPRSLPLAIKFACEMHDEDGNPEFRGMLHVLFRFEIYGIPIAPKFDFCNVASSGRIQGGCEGIRLKIAQGKRAKSFDHLLQGYAPEQQKAFYSLHTVANRYFDAYSRNEVNWVPTDRNAVSADTLNSHERLFLQDIATVQARRIPHQDAQLLDTRLNSIYRRVLANPDFRSPESISRTTSINMAGIRKDERLWLAYRDAWLRFAVSIDPVIERNDLQAWITSQRIDELRYLLPSNDKDFKLSPYAG